MASRRIHSLIQGRRTALVFLAEDADPRITGPVETLCRENGVETESVPTMTELGAACGISVGSAVAAILA